MLISLYKCNICQTIVNTYPEKHICGFNNSYSTDDSLILKVHVSKQICMHYSNTSLKIASLFLPHSYLYPPSISLSHFKSDRVSLDRRSPPKAL